MEAVHIRTPGMSHQTVVGLNTCVLSSVCKPIDTCVSTSHVQMVLCEHAQPLLSILAMTSDGFNHQWPYATC